MPRFPFSEWHAEQLRLTVFPVLGATTRSPEWWEFVVASPPDETNSNLRKGTTVVGGAFAPGKLILGLAPDRIDWLFVPPDPELDAGLPESGFVSIGPVREALRTFSDVAERWFGRDDVPEIARVAFGAILTHAEPDRRSAYALLPDYVPVRVDPDSSSDFLFQINLPVASTTIDGLRLNRLTRLAVASVSQLTLRFTAGAAGAAVASQARPPFAHALRLELDINTVAEFQGPIPRRDLIRVYRELVALGEGIATGGIGS